MLPSDWARLKAPMPANQMCCADSVIDFGLSGDCDLAVPVLRLEALPAGLLAGLAADLRADFFNLAMAGTLSASIGRIVVVVRKNRALV